MFNEVSKLSGFKSAKSCYSIDDVNLLIDTCETQYLNSHVKRETLVRYLMEHLEKQTVTKISL